MEFFLNRYRNLSVLLAAILVQLGLLAYQSRTGQDVRLIRVWAVGAVTPLARVIEAGRGSTSHFFHDYFVLLGVREENRRLKAELDRKELDNQYLRAQLSTADRAKSLAIFQATSKSTTLAAHVIGNSTDTGAKVILVDRGSNDRVQKGMAVITPEGIVGKVINVFSSVSYILLVEDPNFAASVVSEKHPSVHGTLKGHGTGTVSIEYVQNEETVDPGDRFVASGEDLIFPRGTPACQVTVARDGRKGKEIYAIPSGMNGLDDVLIVIEGVHGTIPNAPPADQTVHLLDPPGPDGPADPEVPAQGGARVTDLDRKVQSYRAIGEAEHHTFGDKNSPAPNYNLPPAASKPDDAKSGSSPGVPGTPSP